MTLTEKKQEVWDKVINLYSENIQLIPTDEISAKGGAGTTEGFVSREFKTISATKTDKRGRTIYLGTKG